MKCPETCKKKTPWCRLQCAKYQSAIVKNDRARWSAMGYFADKKEKEFNRRKRREIADSHDGR